MYNKVAPEHKLITTRKVPNHLPNINPARIAIGDKKPAQKTQMVVNSINSAANKNKLDCLNSKKYSLLFLINS